MASATRRRIFDVGGARVLAGIDGGGIAGNLEFAAAQSRAASAHTSRGFPFRRLQSGVGRFLVT